MEHLDTDGQDGRAGRQTEARRRYGVQLLAEKCPRAASLYFFGFGIWTVVVHVSFLIPIIGILLSDDFPRCLMADGIPSRLMSAGVICFTALSIVLSLVALWLKHSAAKRSAPHEHPAPATQETPAERGIQRFAGRHPCIASAFLYGYGMFSAVCMTFALVFTFLGCTPPLYARFLVYTDRCFMLLSVPVAILALCSLRKR